MNPLDIAVKAVEIYAGRHPRPSQVSVAQAAEMLGKSRSTVHRMVKARDIRLNQMGMIPISEVDRLLR